MNKPKRAVLALLASVLPIDLLADEPSLMVPAVASWSAEGEAFRIASDMILFQGVFQGVMYFSGKAGALDASPFSCPARQVIEVESGKASSSGYCRFEAREGALVFADWLCEGVVGACEGRLKIREGTGHLAGISGGGKMQIRTGLSFSELDLEAGTAVKAAEGIAIWPALEIRLPEGD